MTVRVMAQKSGDTAEDVRFALQTFVASAAALNARAGVFFNAAAPADLVSVAALQAKVTPFQAWIDGTSNALQAGYLLTCDADLTLTFAAGNGANPRIDLVVARIRDNPYDASGAQTATVEIVAGTPAGSPVAPAVPASSLALWQVLVPANASGANPINFASARTDRRVWTAVQGTPIRVASAAERNAIANPYAGLEVFRTDTLAKEIYDGTGWRVLADAGEWTAWTPALTANTTNPTMGTGASLSGRYKQIGKTVHYSAEIILGTGATAGSGFYSVSVPVTAKAGVPQGLASVELFDVSAGRFVSGVGEVAAGFAVVTRLRFGDSGTSTTTTTVGNAQPWTWGDGDVIRYSGTYEAA